MLTIGVGNGLALQGTMLTSNQASQIEYSVNVNIILVPTNESLTQNNENKITPDFEVDGELLSY